MGVGPGVFLFIFFLDVSSVNSSIVFEEGKRKLEFDTFTEVKKIAVKRIEKLNNIVSQKNGYIFV